MNRYDVIVVGAGVAGSLVAQRLGRHGRRVLVLEAGPRAAEAGPGEPGPLTTYLTASAKVPGSAYRREPAAAWPEVTDLVGMDDAPGFQASGHLLQDGPLPYASSYVRVNGGTGNVWTGLAPRMLPEDFDTEAFGYGRRWPLTYDDLEPYYRAAEEELGVAADAAELRAHAGLPLPDGYVFPMRPLPASYLDQVLGARLDGRRVKDPVALSETALRVVGTPHARNGTPDPAYDHGRGYVPRGAHGRPDPANRCVGNASCIPHCPPMRSTPRSRHKGAGAPRSRSGTGPSSAASSSTGAAGPRAWSTGRTTARRRLRAPMSWCSPHTPSRTPGCSCCPGSPTAAARSAAT